MDMQREAPPATATVVDEQIFARSKVADDLSSMKKKEAIQSEDGREDVGFESFNIEADESESDNENENDYEDQKDEAGGDDET